ncbi:MAG: ADP-ribosylglycohydrolase family protein [Actinobacteria bacterium]|nr:MAG: ADP-ribosylglycohydrolase family protein [Actinomycetota bacterium]
MTSALYDRIAGGLYGVAYGDAMGMPGELWPRRQVSEHFGWIDRFLPGPKGHFVVDGFRAGQVTDDTQQTVVLAEVIIEGDGTVDAAVLAKRLVEWADRVGASEGNFLGPSSARAFDLIRAGKPLEETGARGDTNGAAMRVVPIGLAVSASDLSRLVATVIESCRPTHFTDVAISGACLIAAAVSAAGEARDFDEVIEPALRAASLGCQHGRPVIAASIVRRAELAVNLARASRDDNSLLDDIYEVVGAGVATTESVPAAFGLAVAAHGDPARCARLAANLGGDSDTIGAMSTGICGAFSGRARIPADAIRVLDEVNGFNLNGLADGLTKCRSGTSQ